MLEQRQNQTLLALIIIVMAVAVIAFLVLRLNTTRIPTLVSDQTITRLDTESLMSVDQAQWSPEFLKYHLQQRSLAPNWRVYTASLNYADYPSGALPPAQPVDVSQMNKPF